MVGYTTEPGKFLPYTTWLLPQSWTQFRFYTQRIYLSKNPVFQTWKLRSLKKTRVLRNLVFMMLRQHEAIVQSLKNHSFIFRSLSRPPCGSMKFATRVNLVNRRFPLLQRKMWHLHSLRISVNTMISTANILPSRSAFKYLLPNNVCGERNRPFGIVCKTYG